jgi:hypothetical protein
VTGEESIGLSYLVHDALTNVGITEQPMHNDVDGSVLKSNAYISPLPDFYSHIDRELDNKKSDKHV